MARAKKAPAAAPVGVAGYRKEFLKDLEEFSGRGMQRTSDAFREWSRMACLPILSGVSKLTGDREAMERYEKEYQETVKRRKTYCANPVEVGGRMLARVVEAMELERRDFLGFCMEELAATNKCLGQFFTPKDVGRLMARVTMGDLSKLAKEDLVSVYEPACGCGVILIEACGMLAESGVAQKDVWVEAEDVDMCAASCCYLQLSLLGIAGVVRRGNTLTLKFSETMYTPGAFLHGTVWRWRARQRELGDVAAKVAEEMAPTNRRDDGTTKDGTAGTVEVEAAAEEESGTGESTEAQVAVVPPGRAVLMGSAAGKPVRKPAQLELF